MKTTSLFIAGVCCGALGAWIFLDDKPDRSPVADGDSSVAAPAAINASGGVFGGRNSGADDAQSAAGREATLESMKRRAETMPRDAFVDALAIEDSGSRTSTLLYVARAWARIRPQETLAQAASLSDDVRALVESAVAEEWAFIDPAGFLSYAEAADSIDQIIAGLDVLLATDPYRVWAIADRHAGPGDSAADALYLSAVRAMAGRDPAGTIARFQALATGQQRDLILTSIAEGYAGLDPDAALAWVLTVQPPVPDATGRVVRIIAVEDPLRAYEVVRQIGGRGLDVRVLRRTLAAAALESGQDTASIATELVQRYEPEFSNSLVSALLNNWVRQSPENAMAWLSANQANVTTEAVTFMISDLAFEDVSLSASLADRVPAKFEFQWLEQTAKRYAQFDSDAAVDWIAQFSARPDYDQLLSQMVVGGIYGNPQFAAGLIESSGDTIEGDLINLAGNFWAEQNPRSAAEWATSLQDTEQSAAAMEGVAAGWVRSDPAAAQQWALEQPGGESRDRILDTLMTEALYTPSGLDYELLVEGYSSDAAADRKIAERVEQTVRISGPDREGAILQVEQMIELLTDPDLHRQAEESLAAAK